jgi:hypothetical protein
MDDPRLSISTKKSTFGDPNELTKHQELVALLDSVSPAEAAETKRMLAFFEPSIAAFGRDQQG